jgi:acetylornithine deacetylase
MTPSWYADLARLVASPTVSGRPTDEVVGHLAARAEDQGFRVVEVPLDASRANLVAVAGPEPADADDRDGLVLSGHVDVVPTDGQPWTTDPFRLTPVDDRVQGRGTADMKGFVAATLAALDGVDVRRLRRRLALVWTCEEEVGCVGAGRLVEALPAALGPLPRACWIGEPTGFVAMRMHAGHVAVHVTVTGEAAHTSRPHLGRNAVHTAADVVAVARALADELRAAPPAPLPMETPWVPLAVTRIHGGTAINVVPDLCTVDLGYRPLPGTDPLDVFRTLEARLGAALGPRLVDVHAHVGTVTPALLTPSGTALGAWLAHHAEAGPEVAPFATDGGQLARLGTAPIVLGPGSIDVAHKADEHVAVADLDRTVRLVRRAVHDLVGDG